MAEGGPGIIREAETDKALAEDEHVDNLLDQRAPQPTRVTEEDRPRHPLIELTLTRVREFLREKEAVFWVFVFPVLLAFALGIAFRNTGPEKLRIAIEDSGPQPQAPAPPEIAAALSRSKQIEPLILSPTEAARALRSGKVALVVRATGNQGTTGPGSGTGLEQNRTSPQPRTPAFDYRYDPTRPESMTARLAVDDALQRSGGRADLFAATDEKVTETGARYIDFLIPGLIGLNLMGSGIWGVAFAVVQARGKKLLKRFAATPMRRSHYLLSFMMSRLVFLALEIIAVLGFAWVVFGVTVRGSLLSLAFVSLLGGLAFSGLGMLVAARPETVEGVSGLSNLLMLPMWLLSGTFFSSERFPPSLQPFIKALPLTAVNDALRANINEGAALWTNWPQLAVILAWGVLSFVIALRIFRWK
ncbi:MAG TPA: ABC transporter permease [Pyrinomonadaceae bacterium]|jgi:ABC-type multidrug transport system permease subunit